MEMSTRISLVLPILCPGLYIPDIGTRVIITTACHTELSADPAGFVVQLHNFTAEVSPANSFINDKKHNRQNSSKVEADLDAMYDPARK